MLLQQMDRAGKLMAAERQRRPRAIEMTNAARPARLRMTVHQAPLRLG